MTNAYAFRSGAVRPGQVLPFDDTLCVREPCLNFEECLSVLKFGNASDFISSPTILFRPIHPVSTFACRCPQGFTGESPNRALSTRTRTGFLAF